jgi:hypothetical protein
MARTIPAAPTEQPGNFNTSALFNAQVRDLNTFALGPPIFYGRQGTAQSVANNTATGVTLDTEVYDSDAFHSTVTNPSRVTPNIPGWYFVLGYGSFAANTAGARSARIYQNGTVVAASQTTLSPSPSGVQWGAPCWAFVNLNGTTDYVELNVAQTSGGALNTYVGVDVAPSLAVWWISR